MIISIKNIPVLVLSEYERDILLKKVFYEGRVCFMYDTSVFSSVYKGAGNWYYSDDHYDMFDKNMVEWLKKQGFIEISE